VSLQLSWQSKAKKAVMKDKDSLDVRKRSIFSSSAESLTSFDDSLSITTQEQLYENIRLHKEIIQSVKLQPWSLSKKYKIVQKAKQYVSKHEDTLQERFAQSGNTKDLYARFKIVLADVSERMEIPWNFYSFPNQIFPLTDSFSINQNSLAHCLLKPTEIQAHET
jgi:hypothetical protein